LARRLILRHLARPKEAPIARPMVRHHIC